MNSSIWKCLYVNAFRKDHTPDESPFLIPSAWKSECKSTVSCHPFGIHRRSDRTDNTWLNDSLAKWEVDVDSARGPSDANRQMLFWHSLKTENDACFCSWLTLWFSHLNVMGNWDRCEQPITITVKFLRINLYILLLRNEYALPAD